MGLFGKKITEEEKQQKAENKEQEKQEEKERKEKFKELTKKTIPYSLSIVQDSDSLAQQNSLLVLYVEPDSTAYLSYTPVGKILKTEYSLDRYRVINFEWLEEIETKGKKVVGRSIAGAMIAGPAGMIVGGVTGKNKKKDKSTAILTVQNDTTKDVRMFSFDCDSKKMKQFKTISTSPVQEKPEEKTAIEQLKEYKELLDLEVITQEEYDKKKAELLG